MKKLIATAILGFSVCAISGCGSSSVTSSDGGSGSGGGIMGVLGAAGSVVGLVSGVSTPTPAEPTPGFTPAALPEATPVAPTPVKGIHVPSSGTGNVLIHPYYTPTPSP